MYKIIKKEKLNSTVYSMTILAPRTAKRAEAGQFIILRVDDKGERIPLTIVSVDKEKGYVEIIFQPVGYSTIQLSTYEEGMEISDFVGPLGKATHIAKHKRVLGIGGGVGAAPLFPQLEEFQKQGAITDVILGARSEDLLILEERFSQFCENVYITTDDGSKGHKGFVTDILQKLIDEDVKYDEVIAIGPGIMMKACVNITKKYDIPTSVSLNPIMIDGTGMCGNCRVTVGDETKFACIDGPDFDGHLVDFDELIRRLKIFDEKEKHMCRIGLGDKHE